MIRHRLELIPTQFRLAIAFCTVAVGIVTLDGVFQIVFSPELDLRSWLHFPASHLEIGFAPEVWLAVVGLTLGTLVIVISIAAQTIPKVAELYRTDWISLGFIWFVMGGTIHSIYLKFFQDVSSVSQGSLTLNLFVLLPIAILLGFPYVFYVLKNIQPETVIDLIVRRHISLIRNLSAPSIQRSLLNERLRNTYHRNLLDALNQLENIFSYVTFKEPKAQIIQTIGILLQEYLWMKPSMPESFFQLSHEVKSDIAFQTMTDEFRRMEQGQTFYEQKCFRVLGNAYINLLDAQDFDLASLCGAKIEQAALTAIQAHDQQLLHVTIIRMNTLMRFALKHGKANDEARHLFNLVFHYRRFIEHLIDNQQKDQAKECVSYLRSYGNEAYHHGRKGSSLLFIVDVIAAEIRKILIQAYQAGWSPEIQRSLLEELLQVDNPPEFDITCVEPHPTNSGVRVLQISLALFYLKERVFEFVDLIIEDILDDREILGHELFEIFIGHTRERIKETNAEYWETTARGTQNLYYSEDASYLGQFLERLAAKY